MKRLLLTLSLCYSGLFQAQVLIENKIISINFNSSITNFETQLEEKGAYSLTSKSQYKSISIKRNTKFQDKLAMKKDDKNNKKSIDKEGIKKEGFILIYINDVEFENV